MRPTSHTTEGPPRPTQELCRGRQRLREHGLLLGLSGGPLGPLTAQHPWFFQSIPTIHGLEDGQPDFTGVQNVGNGLPLPHRGAGTAPGYRQAQPGSGCLGTGRWLSSPFMLLASPAHRGELCQPLPYLLPQAVSLPRGVSLFSLSRSPTKVQGTGSVRRVGPRSPAGHCLHRVAQVSIPAGPRALPSATLLTQGVSSGQSRL